MKKNKEYQFETLQLHVGQETPDPASGARAVPIYATAAYVFENCEQAAGRFALTNPGNIYNRLTNPTVDVFEKRIAALEGGIAALAFASGAAAVTATLQNLARAGEHIVSARAIYGGTYNLLAHTLPEYGITTTFVDQEDPANFEKAIAPNTRAVFIETLGNPNSNPVDIEKIANIAHAHKIPLVIDNTFATPFLLKPIEFGADIVIHSATKFIGGHGTVLGGVVVDSGNFDWDASGKFPSLSEPTPSYHGLTFTKAVGKAAFTVRLRAVFLRDSGATLSPFNAFLLLQGLETLSLRLERHVKNTLDIISFLQKHPRVTKVNHPSVETSADYALYKKYFPKGAGSIFTFEVEGGAKEAQAVIDKLHLFSLLANVADAKSLVIHPASTTHSQMNEQELAASGVKQNSIRLSVGTEHIDDLLDDLYDALNL